MSQYLTKEEIKQWRSSLEKITLEEYARRLGKVLEEEKQTSDIIDIVMQNEKRLFTSRENLTPQKQILKVASKAQKLQDEIMNKSQDSVLGSVKSKITCKKPLTAREEAVLEHFAQNKGERCTPPSGDRGHFPGCGKRGANQIPTVARKGGSG